VTVLSAVVMAQPARLRAAEELRDRHPELDLRIVVDPTPTVDGGPLRTARMAWDAVAPNATHHLVIQDDSALCASFREQLERAIAAKPHHALVLYAEWGSNTSYACRLAAFVGSAWAEPIDHYLPTQALVLPAEVARGFSSFLEYPGPHDDMAMLGYLAREGVPALAAMPNLVEDSSLPSLVGHDFLGHRASVCFLAEPGTVDWSTGTVAPTTVPVFDPVTGQSMSLVKYHDWRRVLQPVTSRYGVPPATVLELGHATLARRPAALREFGQRLLHGMWLTAFGLGLVAADLRGPGTGALDLVLAGPVAHAALKTMPYGALRVLADHRQIAHHREELWQIVAAGVEQGCRVRLTADLRHIVCPILD